MSAGTVVSGFRPGWVYLRMETYDSRWEDLGCDDVAGY